jgi:rubredoxin
MKLIGGGTEMNAERELLEWARRRQMIEVSMGCPRCGSGVRHEHATAHCLCCGWLGEAGEPEQAIDLAGKTALMEQVPLQLLMLR